MSGKVPAEDPQGEQPTVPHSGNGGVELDRDQLIREGWTQGAVLRPEALTNARQWTGGFVRDGGEIPWHGGVIITHPCDAIQPKCDVEPILEVLPYRIDNEKPQSGVILAQHPRELVIERREGWWYFNINDRLLLDRGPLVLSGEKPVGQLDQREVNVLVEWLRRRYTRLELPEAFTRCEFPKFCRQFSLNSVAIRGL